MPRKSKREIRRRLEELDPVEESPNLGELVRQALTENDPEE